MSVSRLARLSRLAVLAASLPALVGAGRLTAATTTVGTMAAGDSIVIAARDLPRGTVLRAADIDTVVTDGESAGGASASSGGRSGELPGEGWVVRRLVHHGEVLRVPAVAPPALISAGSPVSLVWEVGGLRVTRTGTAVGAAHAGETVTVRVDARRRFTGVATAPGTVVVSQP